MSESSTSWSVVVVSDAVSSWLMNMRARVKNRSLKWNSGSSVLFWPAVGSYQGWPFGAKVIALANAPYEMAEPRHGLPEPTAVSEPVKDRVLTTGVEGAVVAVACGAGAAEGAGVRVAGAAAAGASAAAGAA